MNNTHLLKHYLFLLFLIFPLLLFAQNNKKQTKKKECDLTITFDYDVEDLNVIFTNTVQNYDNILWDFGDGNTSKDDSPIHLYSKTGAYEFCISVTKENCTDKFCGQVYVFDPCE